MCPLLIDNVDNYKLINKLNIVCKNISKVITIDWVRHGESCANFDGNSYVDRGDSNRELGYYKMEHNNKNIINQINDQSLLTKVKAVWMYEPNLSFMGMQHAIMLGHDYINKEIYEHNNYDVIVCSPLTRTIMTAMLALRWQKNAVIYVVPFISEIQNLSSLANADFQNTGVGSQTLKKRINFIKDWMRINWINNFDDLEIMQDLINVKKILKNNQDIIIEIDTILNYKPSYGKIEKGGYTNKYEGRDSVTVVLGQIISYMHNNNMMNNNFYAKYYPHIANDFESLKRGASVNFSVLENYENIYNNLNNKKVADAEEYNPRNPNMIKFYEEILPQFINYTEDKKILCISHGSLIRSIWKTKNNETYQEHEKYLRHMRNTHVIRETMKYEGSTFNIQHEPAYLREKFENFESLNIDVCRTQSIKGIINFKLKEPITSSESDNSGRPRDSYISHYGSIFANLLDNMAVQTSLKTQFTPSYDVNFYNKEYEKNIKNNIIHGGKKK